MKKHKTRLLSLLLTLCLMLSLVPAALASNVPEAATEEERRTIEQAARYGLAALDRRDLG